MTFQGVLSRGSKSVAFELYQDGAGNLGIARDVGKPDQKWYEVATENPKARDNWSAVENVTVLGMFKGVDAYSRARIIVEDLVKPHSDGVPLQLDLTDVPGFSSVFEVGVPEDNSIELDYQPGLKHRVDLKLSVPLVTETIGGG